MIKKLLNFILSKFKKPTIDAPVSDYEKELDNDLITLLEIREEIFNHMYEAPGIKIKPKKPKVKKEIKLTLEEETKIVSNIKKKGLYSEPTKKKVKKNGTN